MYETALRTISERMGGKPALGAARALDGLGAIHMRAGRHTAARLRFEEALAIKEGAGTAPGEVTASLVRLGSACYLEGLVELALQHWQRGLALVSARPEGERDGAELARLLNHLGLALHDLKRDDEAEARYLEALALADRTDAAQGRGLDSSLEAGARDTCVADAQAGLAMIRQGQGRHEEALEHYRAALAAQGRAGGGRGGLAAVKILDSMACSCAALGRHEDSAALLRESLPLKAGIFPGEEVYLAECRLDLAAELRLCGRDAEALELCAAARRAFAQHLPPGDPRTAQAAEMLVQLAAETRPAAATRPAATASPARQGTPEPAARQQATPPRNEAARPEAVGRADAVAAAAGVAEALAAAASSESAAAAAVAAAPARSFYAVMPRVK